MRKIKGTVRRWNSGSIAVIGRVLWGDHTDEDNRAEEIHALRRLYDLGDVPDTECTILIQGLGEQPVDVEALVAERDALAEQIDDWKCASGLITSAGDPADIEPRHIEADLREREIVRDALCELAGTRHAHEAIQRLREREESLKSERDALQLGLGRALKWWKGNCGDPRRSTYIDETDGAGEADDWARLCKLAGVDP